MEKRLAIWILGTIGALAVGCAGGEKSRREEPVATTQRQAAPETTVGIVTSVDSRRLMVERADNPGGDPSLYEWTTRSIVVREGREIGWKELHEGDAVRVSWDRGVFGPDRAVRVEVLTGAEADEVRSEIEAGTESEAGTDGFESPSEGLEIPPDAAPPTGGEGFAPPENLPPAPGSDPTQPGF